MVASFYDRTHPPVFFYFQIILTKVLTRGHYGIIMCTWDEVLGGIKMKTLQDLLDMNKKMISYNDLIVEEEVAICKDLLHLSKSQTIRVLGVSQQLFFVQSSCGEGIAILMDKNTKETIVVQPKQINKILAKYDFDYGFAS